MGELEGFGFGIFGGFLAELLGWFRLRHATPASVREWPRLWTYWVPTILMILAGGGIVLVYTKSGAALNPILALHIGASAPLIIAGLIGQVPRIDPGAAD